MSFNQDSQLKVGLLDKPLAIDAVLRGRDIVNCNYRKGISDRKNSQSEDQSKLRLNDVK